MDESSPDYLKLIDYIQHHPTAVVATTNDDGTPHGAVVYMYTASHHQVFFVTKNQTAKYHNIAQRPEVSLTFFDDRDTSTLQANGQAFIANDPAMINYALEKMTKVHAMQAEWLPPISKLQAGEYAIIGIELKTARLATYHGIGIGSDAIFTQLTF